MSKKKVVVQDMERSLVKLDSLDMNIVNELIDDADASSSDIGRKYNKPLSTIQRRRTRLERTVLIKEYSINTKSTDWRSGEFFLKVIKGKAREIAEQTFEKYDKHVTMVTLTSNTVGNMIAHIYFRNSSNMFSIMEDLRRVPNVEDVMYAEHIERVGERKPRFILEDLAK